MNWVPGLVNIVPGKMTVTVDLRNPDDANMRAAEADIIAVLRKGGARGRCKFAAGAKRRGPTVFVSMRGSKASFCGGSAAWFCAASDCVGAGHDAELAHLTRVAMVFVPGEFVGISHNPREFSTEQQCANGVNVMLDVVLSLADEK